MKTESRENKTFSTQLEGAHVIPIFFGDSKELENSKPRETSSSEGAKPYPYVNEQKVADQRNSVYLHKGSKPSTGSVSLDNFCSPKKGGEQISTYNQF